MRLRRRRLQPHIRWILFDDILRVSMVQRATVNTDIDNILDIAICIFGIANANEDYRFQQ